MGITSPPNSTQHPRLNANKDLLYVLLSLLQLRALSLSLSPAICTYITEPFLLCLVSPRQNYLCTSILRIQPCLRVGSVLIFQNSSQICLEGVVKS